MYCFSTCLTRLDRTFSTMENGSDKNGHLCLVFWSHGGKHFTINYDVNCGFSIDFLRVRKFPLFLVCLQFFSEIDVILCEIVFRFLGFFLQHLKWWCIFLSLLIWWITLIHIFNIKPVFQAEKKSKVLCILLFIYCWILFGKMVTAFASTFIRDHCF